MRQVIRSSVDLPQPEGPMIEKNSPALTSNETSLIATTCSDPLSASPKNLLTLCKVRIAMNGHSRLFVSCAKIGRMRERGVKEI